MLQAVETEGEGLWEKDTGDGSWERENGEGVDKDAEQTGEMEEEIGIESILGVGEMGRIDDWDSLEEEQDTRGEGVWEGGGDEEEAGTGREKEKSWVIWFFNVLGAFSEGSIMHMDWRAREVMG